MEGLAQAVQIACDRPVSEWRDALADLPESEREPVRAHLMRFHEGRKERARLDADVDAGRVVWMNIRCGEALKPRTYEQKLEAMKFVPVTSLMKVPQMTRFMDAVQADFSRHGVILEAA